MRNTDEHSEQLKAEVRKKYGEIAESSASCCGSDDTCVDVSESYETIDGYVDEVDLGLGCGLPTEIADLQPGETVLDLGSGGGLDAFIARREVGSEGRVLGVDMTPAMIEKASKAADNLGYDNVEFRLGDIEDMPISSEAIDVVVSNCVLNLVPDKRQAYDEVFRVLKSGGRFCISDIVSRGELPENIRRAAELYVGCVAGAMDHSEYLAVIEAAGFSAVEVVEERSISLPDELLRRYLSADELEAFRATGAGVRSVTVIGRKG